jgi:hypothetical protein
VCAGRGGRDLHYELEIHGHLEADEVQPERVPLVHPDDEKDAAEHHGDERNQQESVLHTGECGCATWADSIRHTLNERSLISSLMFRTNSQTEASATSKYRADRM